MFKCKLIKRYAVMVAFVISGLWLLGAIPAQALESYYLVFFKNGRVYKASFTKEEGEWTHISLNLSNRVTIKTDLIDRVEKRMDGLNSSSRSSSNYPGQAVAPERGRGSSSADRKGPRSGTSDRYSRGNNSPGKSSLAGQGTYAGTSNSTNASEASSEEKTSNSEHPERSRFKRGDRLPSRVTGAGASR